MLAHCYDTLVGDRLAMDRLRGYAAPDGARPTCATSCPARWSSGCSTPWSATTRSPTAGSGSRPASSASTGWSCTTSTRPIGEARAVDYPEARAPHRRVVRPLLAARRRARRRLLRRAAHRRRAARGQARRRLLRAGGPGRVALRADELHRPHGRRHDAGPRAAATACTSRWPRREQTALSAGTGIALAEVPSTFAELLAFDHLHGRPRPTRPRGGRWSSERVEGSFATVFRQTVLTRYEQRAYALRDEGGTLTPERLSEIWFEENGKYYGDSVRAARALPPGLVVHPPLHLDALLHLRLRLRAPRDAGAVRALPRARARRSWTTTSAFLAAGGSAAPADLLGALGVDLDDPGVWEPGFARDGADGRGGRDGLAPRTPLSGSA